MPPISHLPDQVLVMIFSYLNTISETNNLRLVCHHWNQLIVNFWSKKEKLTLDKCIESPELFLEYVTALSKRHPKVKEITLEPINKSAKPNVIEEIPSHYSAIGKVFPRLEKIIFYDTLMEDEALISIVKACPKLQSICLYSCQEIQDNGITKALSNAPQIKQLEIIGCPEISSKISVHLGNLSHLVFEECPFNSNAWIALADAGGKDNLKQLATTPLKYDKLCLLSQKFPKLRQLYIPEFDDEDKFNKSTFTGFPLLEKLCLTCGSVSNTENLNFIASKCPSLKVLWIWNCVNKTIASFIDEIMDKLENQIVHLILDDLKNNQLESMNLQHFGKLKKLTIIGPTLTNKTIQRIIDSCPSLKHLDISDCVPPSPSAIKATHEDFWLNTQPLKERASCLTIEPPFRANYKSTGGIYEGPVLELNCDTKTKYYYRKITN